MHRTRLAITTAALLGLTPHAVHGAAAHVHGEGRLDVAIESGHIEVFLTAPLGDLGGDGERGEAALRARFTDTPAFEFPGADCTRTSFAIEITSVGDADADLFFAAPSDDAHHGDHEEHGDHDDHHEEDEHHEHDDHAGHDDGRLAWRYQCTADPASVRVTLFETTSLQTLNVQAIGARGVQSGTLGAADPVFDLP